MKEKEVRAKSDKVESSPEFTTDTVKVTKPIRNEHGEVESYDVVEVPRELAETEIAKWAAYERDKNQPKGNSAWRGVKITE